MHWHHHQAPPAPETPILGHVVDVYRDLHAAMAEIGRLRRALAAVEAENRKLRRIVEHGGTR